MKDSPHGGALQDFLGLLEKGLTLRPLRRCELCLEFFIASIRVDDTLFHNTDECRYGVFPLYCRFFQLLRQIDAKVFKVLCDVGSRQLAEQVVVGVARLIA